MALTYYASTSGLAHFSAISLPRSLP